MKQYVLVRTLPDGTEKRHSPQDTVRAAAQSSGHVLCDNTGLTKAEAQRFSLRLNRTPCGETLAHPGSGYSFRIETVTEEA